MGEEWGIDLGVGHSLILRWVICGDGYSIQLNGVGAQTIFEGIHLLLFMVNLTPEIYAGHNPFDPWSV